ncbi:MAG TPA: hypothetical protein VLI39_08880 [Sedimentisphaerales bacterium]|nr:hypothetical protein [Sedimentisphaerales bacterium]
MKSLENDRSRRYDTAGGLAEDIRRHLEHEPVLARGPGVAYRVERFLRRHRSGAISAVAFTVLIAIVAAVLSMWNRDRAQLAEAEGFKHRNTLSQAREQYAKADREAALATINPIRESKHVGPEARLLQATILVDNRQPKEAMVVLGGLLNQKPEVAGAAHSLLARILWESGSPDTQKLQEIEEQRKKAEALLPETAEAYFLRAMTALTVKEQLASLDKALEFDSSHYESRRLRAFTYYASRKYEKLKDDALVMTILRPRDALGYALRAKASRELGRYSEAIADFSLAIALTPSDEPQHVDLRIQESETLLQMGDYERVIAEAHTGPKDSSPLQYHKFAALTALGEYDTATALFREIITPGHEARQKFRDWCAKYVFDTLESGRSWHLQDREPTGAAFLPMVEAEETYRSLVAKGGHRLTTDGFSARWSPDGTKLAFSLGVQGFSGVAVFDPATKETDLLIVPGKDPRWSPDGKYIAFVRDCELLRLEELAMAERENQHRPVADEQVWVMNADGTEPRRLAQGSWPSWASDSSHLYYLSRRDSILCSVPLVGQDREPQSFMKCSTLPSVSPDNRHVAHFENGSLKIVDLPSQKPVAECRVPFMSWGVTAWSPAGNEVCLGGGNSQREALGLWSYDLQTRDFVKILDGQITSASWSSMCTELACCLGPPYYDVWTVPVNPTIRTIEALGPVGTLEKHLGEMLAFYTRRIEADPQDAYAYSSRAQYHDCVGDRVKATADMRQWSTVQSAQLQHDSTPAAPHNLRRVINMPFDCELVFSAERPLNTTPIVSVAFGQKGRYEMKLFEMPMFVVSVLGFCVVSGLDSPPTHADFTFGQPVNVESLIPVLNPARDTIECLSPDGLEMYIGSDSRPGGYGGWDMWVSRRASKDQDWGPLENLGAVFNTPKDQGCGSISPDGRTLYFYSEDGPAGYGYGDIYVAVRAHENAPWDMAVNIGSAINSSEDEKCPVISADGLELYFTSYRTAGYGGNDIYVARRATTNDLWGEPENLGPVVNSPYHEWNLRLSPDGLLLLFSDQWAYRDRPRPGGYGDCDIWMTRRATLSDPWQTPVNLGEKINGPSGEYVPCVSPTGNMFYFNSDRGGDYNNYQAPIIPIVDFTGDGQVDGKDLLVMVMNLGGNDSLCDIGPYAWGDGMVDAKDLTVLAEYMGKGFEDPTLVAHWTFDETEGSVAEDSAGDCNGSVTAGATWQLQGGMVGGAIKCDGVTGCVVTGTIPNLGTGPFSVIAWIKGGAPGQILLNHGGTTEWLMANPIDGSCQGSGKTGQSDRVQNRPL